MRPPRDTAAILFCSQQLTRYQFLAGLQKNTPLSRHILIAITVRIAYEGGATMATKYGVPAVLMQTGLAVYKTIIVDIAPVV